MTPPPSTIVQPVVSLAVRVLTLICIFISIIILTTNTVEGVKFKDFYAYRYLLTTTVLGLVYTLMQTILTLLQVVSGNQLCGDFGVHFDFFGDKIISTILATGAAASFGMTQEVRRFLDDLDSDMTKFVNKANAAASLCLIGFVFCAISSTISAYSLPKRV